MHQQWFVVILPLALGLFVTLWSFVANQKSAPDPGRKRPTFGLKGESYVPAVSSSTVRRVVDGDSEIVEMVVSGGPMGVGLHDVTVFEASVSRENVTCDEEFHRLVATTGDPRVVMAALPDDVRRSWLYLRQAGVDLRLERGQVHFRTHDPFDARNLEELVARMCTDDIDRRLLEIASDDENPRVRRSILWRFVPRAALPPFLDAPDPVTRAQVALQLSNFDRLLDAPDFALLELCREFPSFVGPLLEDTIDEELALRILSLGKNVPDNVQIRVILALRRMGTAAAVAQLQERFQTWLGSPVADASRIALVLIQARLKGAPGALALSEEAPARGALSAPQGGGLAVVERGASDPTHE